MASMKILTVLATMMVMLMVASSALAAGPVPGPYRTDDQAARYLGKLRGGNAFCLNGYYSKLEQRTGKHLPQRNNETFASFTCTLTNEQGTNAFYVQTRSHGPWLIVRDR